MADLSFLPLITEPAQIVAREARGIFFRFPLGNHSPRAKRAGFFQGFSLNITLLDFLAGLDSQLTSLADRPSPR